MKELVDLAAFNAAARSGSYTAAARVLGITPSAVSKAVARLERRFAVQLFARTTRSLSLTSAGESLLEQSTRLLNDVAAIEATIGRSRVEPIGRLRISAPLALGRLVLTPALAHFRGSYPGIKLDVRLSDDRDDLVRGAFDAAIRIGSLADSGLIARRLAPHRVAICASPEYLSRRGSPSTPADLRNHDCICFRFRTTGKLFKWPFEVDGRRQELEFDPAISFDEGGALAEAAASGLGVTAVASYIAEPFVREGRLLSLLQPFATEEAPISFIYPEAQKHNLALRAFAQFLTEVIPASPPWDDAVFGR